ncbi:MAG: NTP transferase domain-containing protein, partial [Myxococcales bacterium]|nr:NTP transferase domain-containing protein [Myxococcales bacterium]
MTELTAIVLAAGQGTRMKSRRAKVLHELCGRPMIDFPVRAALAAGAREVVVVVGRDRDEVTAHLARTFGAAVRTAIQAEQRGTGDAVRAALPAVPGDATAALVLYGDTPLVPAPVLAELAAERARGDRRLALLTFEVADPTGYGRILRGASGEVRAVREHRDASAAERAIRECNAGMYCARLDFLRAAIGALGTDNAQGELYLTDVVGAADGDAASLRADATSLAGVNDRAQLAAVEAELYRRIADDWRKAGVTVRESARIDAGVELEPDATIEHGVALRGSTRIGRGARIDVGAVLVDTEVAEGA